MNDFKEKFDYLEKMQEMVVKFLNFQEFPRTTNQALRIDHNQISELIGSIREIDAPLDPIYDYATIGRTLAYYIRQRGYLLIEAPGSDREYLYPKMEDSNQLVQLIDGIVTELGAEETIFFKDSARRDVQVATTVELLRNMVQMEDPDVWSRWQNEPPEHHAIAQEISKLLMPKVGRWISQSGYPDPADKLLVVGSVLYQ